MDSPDLRPSATDGTDAEADAVLDPLDSTDADTVPLPTGEALTDLQVDAFLRWRPANLIAIVGEVGSGKTTLICSLYERFLKSNEGFAGYRFAGSRTLIGFEKRVHLARAESGRAHSDTARTSMSEGLQFYHLALSASRESSRLDLMFSDRTGEMYQSARGDSSLIGQLVEINRAHTVAVLLDGARVADTSERWSAFHAVRQTLQAFLDGGALLETSNVQIVTTKSDILSRDANRERTSQELAELAEELSTRFRSRLGNLTFWSIAARDPSGSLPAAHGVDGLLEAWAAARPATVPLVPLPKVLQTEFDRLLVRSGLESAP